MDHDVVRRLIEAVTAGDDAGVAQALALGADPNVAAGRFRGSVLSLAADSGHLRIVRLLLDAGASAGPTNPHSRSPLRAAVQEARRDVAELLIERGALAAEPVARGSSAVSISSTRSGSLLAEALSVATHRAQPAALETLLLLLRRGAGPLPGEEAPIVRAVMWRAAPAVLRILLDHGAEPNQQRSDGAPILVLAARRGDHAAVDLLLQAGADVNANDARARTALMHAVERDERAVVAVLLLAGADIDKVGADGMTALKLAQGWQRQSIQYMFGERDRGRADVPIARTVIRLDPTGHQLQGDPSTFLLWAHVIERAVDDLGADEWEIRTRTTSEAALGFAIRLRDQPQPATGASWHVLDCTSDELVTAREALLALAYCDIRQMPEGTSHHEITDLFEELERQLGR
jgi:ankyrin repeat protein